MSALTETFSAAELLATVGEHVDMLEELSDTYDAEFPAVLADLKGALAAKDAARLADKAHLMKNVTAMAGGVASRALAVAIEEAAESGSFVQAGRTLEKLEPELLRLQTALHAFVAGRTQR